MPYKASFLFVILTPGLPLHTKEKTLRRPSMPFYPIWHEAERASTCGIFFFFFGYTGSLLWHLDFSSCSMQAPERMGLVPLQYAGSLFPDQGLNPRPLFWKADS